MHDPKRPEPNSLAVGVDIGGTKIAAGVVTSGGGILAQISRATDPTDPDGIEDSVVECVEELRALHDVSAVGVAAAGFVSPDRRRLLFAPNIAWRDHPLADRLQSRIDIPVAVENDANAAGWAEYRFGRGRGAHTMVMLTLGTGLGGAVVTDGVMLRGAFGAATELGHIKIVPGGHHCGCGHEGCWEAYASGTALAKEARNAVVAYPDLAEGLLQASHGKPLDGVHVTQAADAGDPLARELLANFGSWLGRGIATLASVVDPDVVVLGGGIASAAEHFLSHAEDSFLHHLSGRGFRGVLDIVLTDLGNEAGMIGAADSARSLPTRHTHGAP